MNILKYRNALMGVSILFILLFHSVIGFDETIITRLCVRWDIGVDFFLVLSAVGLYHSLSKNANVLAFYKRRFFRIIPTYLLVAVPVFTFFARYFQKGVWDVVLDITLISVFWGVLRYWFIHLILICYLITPFYFKYLKSRFSTILTPIAVLLLNYYVLIPAFPSYEIILCRFPVFLLGLHFAKYLDEGEIRINIGWLSPLFFILLYAMSYVSWIPLWHRFVYFFITIPFLLSIADVMSLLNGKITRIFDFFGRYTLELYLVHESICMTFVWKYYHENVYIYIFLCLVFSIPIAMAVNRIGDVMVSWIKKG